jgi:hypothetical protein
MSCALRRPLNELQQIVFELVFYCTKIPVENSTSIEDVQIRKADLVIILQIFFMILVSINS